MTTRELMTVGFWSDDDWMVEPEKDTKTAKVDDSKQCDSKGYTQLLRMTQFVSAVVQSIK